MKKGWLFLTWGFICSVIAFISMYFLVYLKFKTSNPTSDLLSMGASLEGIILLSLVLGFIVGSIIVILSKKKRIK